MVWDVLNALVQQTLTAVHAIYALLPQSPIYVNTSVWAQLAPVLATAAWAFPVHSMIIFLAVYLAAVLVLAGVLLIKQFIEAVIP